MTRRTIAAIALAAAALTLGFGLGRTSSPTRVERDLKVERFAQIVPGAPGAGGASTEAVRAVVREELARRGPAAAADEEALAHEPEDEAALASARQVLERGMADGQWTEDERDHLRAELAQLTGDQAQEILHTLIPALNADRLRVNFDGPLF